MPIQIDLGSSSSSSSPSNPSAQPTKKGPIVGIDLGTTNSLVAFVRNGKPEVLKTSDSSALLPSVVEYSLEGRPLSVGAKAVEKRSSLSNATEKFSSTVVFSAKRLMGRALKDLKDDAPFLPYRLIDNDTKGQALIALSDTVAVSPIETSSEILKALKHRAEETLGEAVDRAVVTVPAYFDDAQRSATKAAGRLAGLDVVRVINEPTAAALAFGWSFDRPGKVVVFDLGGGTFDVSVLRIEPQLTEVISTLGDTHLGGDDFDRALAEWGLAHLLNQGVLSAETPDQEKKQILSELLVESERAKIALSDRDTHSFKFREHSFALTRAEANDLWRPLVQRCLKLVDHALDDARLVVSDIDDVVMVGGSTRVPLVRESVAERFGKAPNTSLNPDEAVALGASLQAEVLAGLSRNRLLLDVVPLSLGLETMGGVVTKVIHRNSTIPVEAREIYTNHVDKQTAFDIHVLQGERELVQDCRSLAKFKLRGLDPAPAGFHRIEVVFRVDASGILSVQARDLRSSKQHLIEVMPSFGLTDDEFMVMLEKSFDHAEDDIAARLLAEIKVEADTVLIATEKALKNAGHLLDPTDRSEVHARLVDLKNHAKGRSSDAIRQAIADLDAVSQALAELQVNAALNASLGGKKVDLV